MLSTGPFLHGPRYIHTETMRPERYPQQDFFFADIFDASPKADIPTLEHPVFALAKQPDTATRDYSNGDRFVRVIPSSAGMATIWDKDILIYCISQLREGMNRGREVDQNIYFHAYDLFKATNKPMNGNSYRWLKEALTRLRGMTIETNVSTGGREEFDTFGLVDDAKYIREQRESKMEYVKVKLSDWQYRAVENKEVLTLSRDYFRIGGALQRRLYEIGRKHCGRQKSWAIGLERLHAKAGAKSSLKSFRYALQKAIASDDSIPDYVMDFNKLKDQVIYTNKRHGPSMLVRALRD